MKAIDLLASSTARQELYNVGGLQVYATKKYFEIKCGTLYDRADSLQKVSEKVDALPLHQCPTSGDTVISAIQDKMGRKYRLDIQASKGGKVETVHSMEGSIKTLADNMSGLGLSPEKMEPDKKYSMDANIFDGEYAVLVPLADLGLSFPEVIPNKLYEPQRFTKNQVVVGLDPATQDVIRVLVEESYPNGSFKARVWENEFRIYSAEDCDIYGFVVEEMPCPEEQADFREPDDSLYKSDDIPTYNPTEDVAETTPILGNLKNYDSILTASSEILGDFAKTLRKTAYVDRSSLNKISVSAVNEEGHATEGALEWNLRLGSPYYKRSSQITIPMVLKAGVLDLGREFITSTGQKFPLTAIAIGEHMGSLADDDPYRSKFASAQPSTLKVDADIDNLIPKESNKRVGTVKKTANMLYGNNRYTFTELPNGALEIGASEEGVADLKGKYAVDESPDQIYSDVTDDAVGNGFGHIAPEEIGALTDAPILGYDVGISDDGELEVTDDSKIWWYPDYQVTDPMEVLMNEGKVVFTNADEGDKTAAKKTANGESWSDVMEQQQAIESSETPEEAVQKLKDGGYESTFSQTGSDHVETIEELVDRVWGLYKEGSKKTAGTGVEQYPEFEEGYEGATELHGILHKYQVSLEDLDEDTRGKAIALIQSSFLNDEGWRTLADIDVKASEIMRSASKKIANAQKDKLIKGMWDKGMKTAANTKDEPARVFTDSIPTDVADTAAKKTANGESWSDVVAQQEAIETSDTPEEAVQKLKDMGYESTFKETGSDHVETIEELIDRVWGLYKEGSKKTADVKIVKEPEMTPGGWFNLTVYLNDERLERTRYDDLDDAIATIEEQYPNSTIEVNGDIVEITDKTTASKKTAVRVDYGDDAEISNWVMNDEGLYNWALESGVDTDDVGDESNADYQRFVEENRTEIVDGINRSLGNTAAKKTAEVLPKDLTQLTEAQTTDIINQLVGKPLDELRRMQDIVEKQIPVAAQQGNDAAVINLQRMQDHLTAAVDEKEFGSDASIEPQSPYGVRDGSKTGSTLLARLKAKKAASDGFMANPAARHKTAANLVSNLGDANPLDHGGFLIYDDGEAVYWAEPEETESMEIEDATYDVYRFSIANEDALSDLNWIKEEDLVSMADTMGMSVEQYKELAVSDDVLDRAQIYRDAGSHWGFNNLDGYPDKFSYKEMVDLYGKDIGTTGSTKVGSEDKTGFVQTTMPFNGVDVDVRGDWVMNENKSGVQINWTFRNTDTGKENTDVENYSPLEYEEYTTEEEFNKVYGENASDTNWDGPGLYSNGEKFYNTPQEAADADITFDMEELGDSGASEELNSALKDVLGTDKITRGVKANQGLTVFDKHQKKIALDTLKMSDSGADIMGGMTKEEARDFLKKIGYSDDKIRQIEASKKTASDNEWVSDDGKLKIYETFHDFQIEHIPSGESRGIGDGVDMFTDENDEPINVGTPEFYAQMPSFVNDPTLMEAYFPDVEASKKTSALEDVYQPGMGQEAFKDIEKYSLEDISDEEGNHVIILDTLASEFTGSPASAAAQHLGVKDSILEEIKTVLKEDPDQFAYPITYDEGSGEFKDKDGTVTSENDVIDYWGFSWESVEEAANKIAEELNEKEPVPAPYDNGQYYFGHPEHGGGYSLMYSFEMPDDTTASKVIAVGEKQWVLVWSEAGEKPRGLVLVGLNSEDDMMALADAIDTASDVNVATTDLYGPAEQNAIVQEFTKPDIAIKDVIVEDTFSPELATRALKALYPMT